MAQIENLVIKHNTVTKTTLDIIIVDIAKDIMVDIAEENVIESKHIAKETA